VSKILYSAFDVVPSPKGASTHIIHFVRRLVNAGNKVHMITPSNGVLPVEDTLESATVSRIASDLNANYLERVVSYGKAVMDHVDSTSYDVVHFRSIWSGLPLVQARERYGYKTIFEVNGLPSIELKYHYPGLRDADLLMKIREQEIATLLLCDAILCPSQVTKNYLMSLGADRRKIHVIPNGVNPEEFTASPLVENKTNPTLLYTGTLADWQGIDFLIQAMPKILEQQLVRLRIVGPGRKRQRKDLAKQIRKLGMSDHIQLEDPVPHHEVPKLIASSDVCVSPLALNDRNLTQGCCPIKVLEYMSCGRPIVATNLPVIRELLREDVDALLFAPNDMDDMVRQICRILSDRNLASSLAANAAQSARSQFTWHRAGKKLLKVYDRLAVRSSEFIRYPE